ncbi:MAG: type IV toxin-antitoxin system AbiEi family antitoxin domain-containing protein [Marmoricola sp.]
MEISAWLDASGSFLGPNSPLPLDCPFTADQAAAWEVSRQTLRRLVSRGLVRRVLRGVYAVTQMPDDIESRASALSLVVPPAAVVTDRTAAWFHGVDILPRSALSRPPPLSVFQISGTRVRRQGVHGGKRGLLARDVTEVSGVRVTTRLRTTCDLGRLLWRFDALSAIDGFLGIGLDQAELIYEEPRFKGFRGVRQLRLLAPLGDHRAESPGESALRLHWYDAGLPRPELQYWIADDFGQPSYRLDIALPELRFAAEYDGEEFHTAQDDSDHDEERRDWISTRRHWHIEVFDKNDVYAPNGDPIPRLLSGAATARRSIAVWTPRRRTARSGPPQLTVMMEGGPPGRPD